MLLKDETGSIQYEVGMDNIPGIYIFSLVLFFLAMELK